MPRQVFSGDMEKKLMELWAVQLKSHAGSLKKRTQKENVVARELNAYADALHPERPAESVFTDTIIHNKLDNLKTKARHTYKRYRKQSQTGAANYDELDLEAAYQVWSNFRTWHELLGDVPGYGPCLNSVAVCYVQESSPLPCLPELDGVEPGSPVLPVPQPVTSASAQTATSASAQTATSAQPANSLSWLSGPFRPPVPICGKDPDDVSRAEQGRSSMAVSRKRKHPSYTGHSTEAAGDVADVDGSLDEDSESDDNVTRPSTERIARSRKTKKRTTPNVSETVVSETVGSETVGSETVAEIVVKALAELQANNNRLVSAIIQNQQTHMQTLVQSHMEFTAKLFDKYLK